MERTLEENEALMDLLWMSQGRAGKDIFLQTITGKRQYFAAAERERYIVTDYNVKYIKFRRLTADNLLLRALIEDGILQTWIEERAKYKKNNKGKLTRIYNTNIYSFMDTNNSFYHDDFWAHFYDEIWEEMRELKKEEGK